jgi:RNase P subunit RPR2
MKGVNPMWKAKHTVDCKDQTRYQVIKTNITLENQAGFRVAVNKPPEIKTAICLNCNAPAEWVEK